MSRKDAKKAGLAFYFTGKPCLRGHVANRFTINSNCKGCRAEYAKTEEYGRKNRANVRAYLAARKGDPAFQSKQRDRKRDVMRRRRAKPEVRAKERAYQLSPKGRAQMKLRYNKRRARLANAFVEDVSIEYLMERHGGCCRLCGDSLSLDTKFPHPKSPTSDHIIPLTKGGKHERGNLQLACYACNLSKGNRLMGELPRRVS